LIMVSISGWIQQLLHKDIEIQLGLNEKWRYSYACISI
jgi:hypothetical protein